MGGGAQGSNPTSAWLGVHAPAPPLVLLWLCSTQDELQGAPKVMDPVQVSRLKTKARALETMHDDASVGSSSTLNSEIEENMRHVR